MTDAKGRVASFKNSILIMTSNVGSEYIAQMNTLGFIGKKEGGGKESLKEKVTDSLKEQFRPEFLNRIDEIIIFNYLGKSEIKKIVDLELEKVSQRLRNKKIEIKISEPVKQFLAERGFDPNLGARPLKRVIQKLVLDPLSLKIVSGKILEKERVVVDLEGDKIVFQTLGNLIRIKPRKEKVNA